VKGILKAGIVMLAVCLPFNVQIAFGFLPETTFQLSFEDKDLDPTPLSYKTVYVYNGDYKFQSANFDPYPYGQEALKHHWLIQTVTTDGRGKFDWNADVEAKTVCFKAGKDYRLICVEKSLDLSHTPSDHHLRVIVFDKGSTQVNHNDIYDLKRGTVTTIDPDGRQETKRFKNIGLTVQKEK